MTKSGWLSLLRITTGKSRKNSDEGSLCGNPNVNEEYLEAFRTKSYLEICNKAQEELNLKERVSTKKLSSKFSNSISNSLMYLTEHLLEPRQEVITNITKSFNVNHLIVNYFESTLEACHYCDTILQGIRQTRLSYARVTKVVKLTENVLHGKYCIDHQWQKAIYGELNCFAMQNSPLSIMSPAKFRDIHETYTVLLNRLRSKKVKIRRTIRIKRVCKSIGGIGLVVSQCALLVALLVFAFHSMIGLVVTPCIVSSLFGLMRKRFFSWSNEKQKKAKSCRRVYEQLDVAAKGVYILINDLDTMSCMVKRLDDEIEHWREVASICVRNGTCEILKEFVKEFHDSKSNFLDQLEELEEHIYLCFLTINRSRRLVMQEITEKQC